MARRTEPRLGNEYWTFNPEARRGAGEYRYNWPLILNAAAQIVVSYRRAGSDEATVTLRQLFYRLVSAEMLPNTQQAYGSLSSQSAEARRGTSMFFSGTFPKLMDRGRDIDRPELWESAVDASGWLSRRYMHDRSATQEKGIYVVVEKNALRGQLFQWFAPLGLPVIALGGYPSQSLADEVREDVLKRWRGKETVCIYAGDFDADGQDIARDFDERTQCWDEMQVIALTPEQIADFALPPMPGKWSSARAKGFAEKYHDLFMDTYGYDLVQIELDALPPEELRRIYTEAIDEHFDREPYDEAVADEKREQKKVDALADRDLEGLLRLGAELAEQEGDVDTAVELALSELGIEEE